MTQTMTYNFRKNLNHTLSIYWRRSDQSLMWAVTYGLDGEDIH